MPTQYTTLLGLAKPQTGELSGTWGATVNDYLTEYLDAAVAGAQTISGSQTAVTLSKTEGSSLVQAGAGAAGSSQYSLIRCTGNPASTLTITVPATSKVYLVVNATSTSQDVKVVGAGPTTGITVAAAQAALIAWSGTDFVLVATTDVAKLSGVLPVANGGTGITSFGTGVATALGINTGSAGAFVVNGGVLGTPSSGTLTNATGLPISTGVSGLGTNVATALAVNVGSAGAVVVNGGALGTPSSGTLTNATGLPISTGVSGLGSNVATFLGTPSSANLAAAVTDETGTGALVFANSPALSGSPTAPTQAAGTNDATVSTTAFVQAALNALYPVGSIYINATNSTNPGTLLGFGTWVAFGAGRVPVGYNASDPLFDSAEETGGSKDAITVSHTHTGTTGNQSADHTHTGTSNDPGNFITGSVTANIGSSAGLFIDNTGVFGLSDGNQEFAQFGGVTAPTRYRILSITAGSHTHTTTTGGVSADHNHSFTTDSTGSSGTNANLQPYVTVFMWKRTA